MPIGPNHLACSGCAHEPLHRNTLPAFERLLDPSERLSPAGHAIKIAELFNLTDPKEVTRLQRIDPGEQIVKRDSRWLNAAGAEFQLQDGYILNVQTNNGSSDYRLFKRLERAAQVFANTVSAEEAGQVSYTVNSEHPSPLMFVSKRLFAVVFKAGIPEDDLKVLLSESRIRNI